MNQIANVKPADALVMETVLAEGDLSRLTPEQRLRYYLDTCKSLDLNPYTRPLDYIRLNGKLTLYAKRDAADQLRAKRGISLKIIEQSIDNELFVVRVQATDKSGRTDEDMGAVQIAGLKGEARANATLKAVTKAKRRVTLSICGLGFLDETEIGGIPEVRPEPNAMPAPKPGSMREFAATLPKPTTAQVLNDDIPTFEDQPAETGEPNAASEPWSQESLDMLRGRVDAAIQAHAAATSLQQIERFKLGALFQDLASSGADDLKDRLDQEIERHRERLTETAA